jgi:hypothetical protein
MSPKRPPKRYSISTRPPVKADCTPAKRPCRLAAQRHGAQRHVAPSRAAVPHPIPPRPAFIYFAPPHSAPLRPPASFRCASPCKASLCFSSPPTHPAPTGPLSIQTHAQAKTSDSLRKPLYVDLLCVFWRPALKFCRATFAGFGRVGPCVALSGPRPSGKRCGVSEARRNVGVSSA